MIEVSRKLEKKATILRFILHIIRSMVMGFSVRMERRSQ